VRFSVYSIDGDWLGLLARFLFTRSSRNWFSSSKCSLFGVTTLDIVRASAFLSGVAGTKPSETDVPVVGGHSGPTIVPLLSQLPAGKKVVEEGGEKLAALVKRIQFGGDEVVKAKDGAGSATLSMAYGPSFILFSPSPSEELDWP
jgi:malate/lactate dehydrogenase